MQAEEASRPRGRPRQFDEAEALEAAMRTFWARGYDGTSIDRLTRAMKLTRSSLYQAFGGKERLFFAALDRYVATRLAPLLAELEAGRALSNDLRGFLRAVVDLGTSDPAHPGCLVSSALSDAAGAYPRMAEAFSNQFRLIEGRLAERVRQAQKTGEIAPSADAEALGAVAAALAHGLMLRARAGGGKAELLTAAETGAALLMGGTAVSLASAS